MVMSEWCGGCLYPVLGEGSSCQVEFWYVLVVSLD